jgi:hypothetical protein
MQFFFLQCVAKALFNMVIIVGILLIYERNVDLSVFVLAINLGKCVQKDGLFV